MYTKLNHKVKNGDEYEIPMDKLVEMVFEMEAYDNDENLEYLDKRKFMAWWKYR